MGQIFVGAFEPGVDAVSERLKEQVDEASAFAIELRPRNGRASVE